MTFVVFALPRSRTAWTAAYLSQNASVGHDSAIECETPDDFFVRLNGNATIHGLVGTVETAAMLGWGLIRERLPNARFAVIRRRVVEVERSLSQFGIIAEDGELLRRARMLDDVIEHPGVLTVQYDDLYHAETRRELFEHCLERPWDEAWDREMAGKNIQINVMARMKYLIINHDRIEALKRMLVG